MKVKDSTKRIPMIYVLQPFAIMLWKVIAASIFGTVA
jgi:hypothetical protein